MIPNNATASPLSTSATTDKNARTLELGRGRGAFHWMDYQSPDGAQLDALQQQYDLHPLAMEDVRTYDERAKVLDFGAYLFISIHSLTRQDEDIIDHELEIFLGRDYLITIHNEPMPIIDVAFKRFQGDPKRQDLGPDFFLYLIADEMTNALFPMLDKIDDEIDTVEEETLDRATPKTLSRIFKLKHTLIQMRRSVAPMRDVMNALAGTRFGLVDSKTALYYRDLYDRLSRIYELIETARDLLGNTLDTYLSAQGNRLNQVMKALTIISVIFLPLSFIVGWGGMNFVGFMPFSSEPVYLFLNASLLLIPIGMLAFFKYRNWF